MTDVPGEGGRANGRPGVRAEDEIRRPGVIDHAERAKRRMAEIRALQGDDDGSAVYEDKYFAEAPPGWSYEWKTESVFNKQYPQYMAGVMRNGWSPVPADRHRHLLYPEYTGANIIVDGLILMERPKEMTERRRAMDKREAEQMVQTKEAQLADAPPGTAPRHSGHADPFIKPRINSSVGPANIPD